MTFTEDDVRELARRFPGTEQAEEAKVRYFRIPPVDLPDGCSPTPVELLLCPSPVGGYEYRLYFAKKIKTPKEKTGTRAPTFWARLGTHFRGKRRSVSV